MPFRPLFLLNKPAISYTLRYIFYCASFDFLNFRFFQVLVLNFIGLRCGIWVILSTFTWNTNRALSVNGEVYIKASVATCFTDSQRIFAVVEVCEMYIVQKI